MTRTIVISDVHMPRPKTVPSADLLKPLLDQCDRLVVNGDLAETHMQGLLDRVEREVLTLQDIADRSGTELLLLCGNHDPELSPWRAAEFAGGRILLTHGDAFQSNIAPWAREAAVMQKEWERVGRLHEGTETIRSRFDSVRSAAIAEWWIERASPGHSTLLSLLGRPNAAMKILLQWKQFPTLARRFAASFFPWAEWILVGHCHRYGIDRSERPTVINTGAFGFPTRPLGVVLEDDRLEVHRLHKGRHGWTLAPGDRMLEEQVEGAGTLSGLHGPPDELPEGSRTLPSARIHYPRRPIECEGDEARTDRSGSA